MKFSITLEHGHKTVYEADVVARKINGFCTAFPSRIDGALVERPADAKDRYFIDYDYIDIIEISDEEKNMEIEL